MSRLQPAVVLRCDTPVFSFEQRKYASIAGTYLVDRICQLPTYNGRDRKNVLIRQIREAIAQENRKDSIERLWKERQQRIRKGFRLQTRCPMATKGSERGLPLTLLRLRRFG